MFNQTNIVESILFSAIEADKLDSLYKEWFHNVVKAWLNSEVYQIDQAEAKKRVNYIVNNVGKHARQEFMQELVNSFEKLSLNVGLKG